MDDEDRRFDTLKVDKSRHVVLDDRRSRIVRKLRFILPFLALILTVIVVTWDESGKHIEPLKKEELIPASQNVENELLKPVFNSVDEKNQPYTVTADRAVQSRTTPDFLDLEKPKASLTQTDKTVVGAESDKGVYAQKEQKLDLSGNVVLTYSEGYTLKTPSMRVDLKAQKTYADQGVVMEGKDGTLTSTGLEGDSGNNSLIFTGPATLVLKQGGNLFDSKGTTP